MKGKRFVFLFLVLLCSCGKNQDPLVGIWLPDSQGFRNGTLSNRDAAGQTDGFIELKANGEALSVLYVKSLFGETYFISRGTWAKKGRRLDITYTTTKLITSLQGESPTSTQEDDVRKSEETIINLTPTTLQTSQSRQTMFYRRGPYPANLDSTLWLQP